MALGFVMLCHTALHRAAEVARFWAGAGHPVVIHIDGKVPEAAAATLRQAVQGLANVSFAPRFGCEWGSWPLVRATQAAAEQLLGRHPEVDRVYLASGSCLPLRPPSELAAYLAARPGTDFIESVTATDVDWTVDGLSLERFTLRFPFSWTRRRRKECGWR